MSEMEDISSVLEIQRNTTSEKEVDISGRAKEDAMRQPPLIITEGDDSVFYTEGEEISQQSIASIWAPCSGEPVWPEKLSSETQSSCHSIVLMEASSEHDSGAMLKEMGSKMENKVNNASSTDTDVHGETASNRRITHAEELLVPPVVPLGVSTSDETAQIKERAVTDTDESSSFLPDDAREAGVSGVEKVEQEHGLDVECKSNDKPFNHLTHPKYGTVSYRKIQRGQTRKKIEMFESMMQL
ncbi:uncharacterized protein LOC128524519 [Clarias gariepinus]|uniref:uncharacterized protein LOC128524519 n=1 Tax=Clarias gariepinus TaxID=13013 RepID=UPI00234C06B5|nr:uncharacterized protein LOC128524519 [Clarias gariepinus]